MLDISSSLLDVICRRVNHGWGSCCLSKSSVATSVCFAFVLTFFVVNICCGETNQPSILTEKGNGVQAILAARDRGLAEIEQCYAASSSRIGVEAEKHLAKLADQSQFISNSVIQLCEAETRMKCAEMKREADEAYRSEMRLMQCLAHWIGAITIMVAVLGIVIPIWSSRENATILTKIKKTEEKIASIESRMESKDENADRLLQDTENRRRKVAEYLDMVKTDVIKVRVQNYLSAAEMQLNLLSKTIDPLLFRKGIASVSRAVSECLSAGDSVLLLRVMSLFYGFCSLLNNLPQQGKDKCLASMTDFKWRFSANQLLAAFNEGSHTEDNRKKFECVFGAIKPFMEQYGTPYGKACDGHQS